MSFFNLIALLLLAAPGFTYVDLSAATNANPLSKDDLFVEGVEVPPTPYLWIEGEAAGGMSRAFDTEAAAAASRGEVLGGAFGSREEDWAEWYFDLPWQSENALLYIRTAREGSDPFTALRVSLNGEERGQTLVPENDGWGGLPVHFKQGLCSLQLGRVHMGRQVLRITGGNTAEAVHIDGFWLAQGPIDIVNRLAPDGEVRAPASIYELVYPFGERRAGDVWFLLPEPVEQAHNTIVVLESDPVELPIPSVQGAQLAVLGAGVRGPVELPLALVYSDGRVEEKKLQLGPLYSKRPEEAKMNMGAYRYAYTAELPLADKPLESIRFLQPPDRAVVLAVTVVNSNPVQE